jgi:hypothetical protein
VSLIQWSWPESLLCPLTDMELCMHRYKFRSFWDCVTQTKQTEGMRGFWRGMRYHASIILFFIFCGLVLHFSVDDACLRFFFFFLSLGQSQLILMGLVFLGHLFR